MGFLKGHTKGLESIAFSKAGEMMASSEADGTIILWQFRGFRA
jgi:WD40 repeat protein